ncbi:MAG: GcvT family protein [Candidatus Rokubacteria bacterium]|nr:GcvT family protein [Candidatus Rokubacteria bacterium]
MTDHSRVVIIGGGVAGCSIAYHLSRLGWREVVVLDKGELTSGSTFHSAGLVGQLRSSVALTRINMWSVELYDRLGAETGGDPGWRKVGSLRLASSKERLLELKRQAGWARTLGFPLTVISAREAVDLFPLLSAEGVEGAAYLPTDGHIDPGGLTYALADGARAKGVRFQTGVRVRAITVENGRVSEVVTDHGTVKTEVVVNAAGIWAPEIGRMVGVHIPIVPMSHQYLTTKPIEGVRKDFPIMRDPDRLVYFREEVGGLVMGGFERQPASWGLDGIPPDFTHRLLSPDWERFSPLMENAVSRVPEVAKAQVIRLINGPEAYAPDGEFILGEAPGVRGFFVAAGFCAHGIAGAGGVGKVMAEWIVEGRPSLDLWRMDIRRFGAHSADRACTLAQAVETYATYYDIHYPFEERRAGRGLRLSPAYPRLQALGCAFGEKAGWERPNWFEVNTNGFRATYAPVGWQRSHWSPAIEAEHRATRERAGLFDATSFSKLDVSGPGALALLQRLTDNEMDRPVGSVTYTQMLNEAGGIECDLTVTRLAAEQFFLVTGSAFGPHDLAWIRRHLPSDGSVSAEDVTERYACIGLWGPLSREILRLTTTDNVSNATFPYMTARPISVGGVGLLALRVTYVGELGWEMYAPTAEGLTVWDALWGAGRNFGLLAAGYRAIDSLRLEKGYRYWSAEVTPEDTPYEAGLGFCVKLDKGDFIGRPAVIAQRERGLERRLVCLTLADPLAVALGGEPILAAGRPVGRVTSGGYGYTVAKSLAYGYVPVARATVGTPLAVEVFGEAIPARVAPEPLYDPAGAKIKA